MNEEKKPVGEEAGEKEEANNGITFDEKTLEKVKEQAREAVLEDSKLTAEQRATWDQIVAEAQMPINLTNKEFKLGPQELDIRNLNNKNIQQMLFRVGVIDNIYLKQLLNVGLDLIRLLMVIASQLGVENISKATDDVLEKEKQANNLENIEVNGERKIEEPLPREEKKN